MMLIVFCMGSPDDVKAWYELILNAEPSRETLLLLVLTFICIVTLLNLIKGDIKSYSKRRKTIRSVLSDYGKEYSGHTAERLYIPARFQSSPPDMALDLSEPVRTVASQNLMDFYLKQVLVKNNTVKHLYMILGGSGMGKSSFVVQLVKRYYRKYLWSNKPYELALVPCGSKNVVERVRQINDKRNVVLILDALDESSEAIEDFDGFIEKLETVMQDFFHVIITCRTQFFNSEDDIRKSSILSAQTAGKGFIRYEHQFIAPFTDQEIDSYLRKKYFFHWKQQCS